MSDPKDPKPKIPPQTAPREFEPDLLLDSLLDDQDIPKSPSSIPGPKLHEPAKRSYPADEVTMVGRPEDLTAGAQEELEDAGDVDELLDGDWDEKTNIMNGSDSRDPAAEAIRQARVAAARQGVTVNLPSIEATAKPPAVNPAGPARREPFLEASSPKAPPARTSVETPNARFSAVNNDSVVTSADSFLPPPASLVISEGNEEETHIFRPSGAGGEPSEPRVPRAAPIPSAPRQNATPKAPPSLAVADDQEDETRIFRPAFEMQPSEPPSQKAPPSSAKPPSSRKTPPPLPGSRHSPPPFPGPHAPPSERSQAPGFTSKSTMKPMPLTIPSGTENDSDTHLYRVPPKLAVSEGDSETKLHRADDLIAATRDSRAPTPFDTEEEDFKPTQRPPADILADPFGEESIRTPIIGLSASESSEAPAESESIPHLAYSDLDESEVFESLPPAEAELRPTPPPPAASKPPSMWPDERNASAHLLEQNLGESWSKRAEWFESEAHSATDPQAKARALLIASELWALVGDTPRAREVATEASALTRQQPMVLRQLRALAASEDDYKAVAAALEMETRSAATASARVHAAYLSSEVHRLVLKEPALAKKKLDLALRADADDARAHLSKLVEALARETSTPRVKLPEKLEDLNAALDEVAALRSGSPASASPATPQLVFDAARRALATGDRAKAAHAIRRLSDVAGVGKSATWLAASLLAHDEQTRGAAIELLTSLVNEHQSAIAARALAARALEQGDAESVRNAILPKTGDVAQVRSPFKDADKVALAALTGVDPGLIEAELIELSRDDELRPLAAAAVAAAPNPEARREILCGTSHTQNELRLGRSLAGAAHGSTLGRLEWLKPAMEAFGESHRDEPLYRALNLEFASSAQAHTVLAQALAEFSGAGAERDRRLVAALIYEFGRDRLSAKNEYQAALAEQPNFEAAVRALLDDEEPKKAADRLIELANLLGDSSRSALLLTEAALYLGGEDAEAYEALLKRAIEADPALFLAVRLGEQHARKQGNAEQLLEWLRARRDATSDPIEKALDQVREALLVADTDVESAAALLDDAVSARPSDIGLRELSERLGTSRERDRASWREQVAASASGASKEALLIQATVEYDRAGDHESAAQAAFAALEVSQSPRARVLAERNALHGPSGTRISEELLSQARSTEHPEQARALYSRLCEIDRQRGDLSSALLWQTAILDKSPQHLPALRYIEQAFIGSDRGDELEAVAATLANVLGNGEANAHARLASRLRIKAGAWSQARELALLASKQDTPRLWAFRLLSALARATDDTETMLQTDRRLFELATHTPDKATLALRAAEASTRLGRFAEAKQLLEQCLELIPDHLVALSALAEVLDALGDFRAAAKALEAEAEASAVIAHKVNAWHDAAILWLDKLNEPERGRMALEQAVALDTSHEDAVLRLQALYVQSGERQKLARLLEQRIEHCADPEERIALEVARGRALAEVGEREAAKAALAAALDGNPDHVEALEALADLSAKEGDWASAEQAFIRLARHVIEPERQAQIYRKLGALYDTALPNPQRAELAYREVLKRDPNDTGTVARLIQVYAQLGDTATAVALQTELLNRAQTPEQRRDRTIQLALVEEQINRDRRRAEAILEKARKDFPLDGRVLRALAEFHVRGGDSRPAQMLMDRAASDARRALATGRFEPAFFEILSAVAEFRNAPDAALVAQATLAALYGDDIGVRGAGLAAGSPSLDDLLAPDVLSAPLRTLLRKTGEVLDTAYPVDLKSMRAVAIPSGSGFNMKAREVGDAFGVHGLEVFVSPGLGPVCLALSAAPAQIVVGPALLDSQDEAARFFLLIRAVKLLQVKAAALSRTAPIELGAVMSAHLSQFAPTFSPTGVDARKFADAKQRLAAAVARHKIDSDVPMVALEVIGAIGNRMSQIATALHQWGNRAALLAIGDPVAALRAIALAGGHGSPPVGAERIKWIGRNAEARDLATFSVSDHYAQARERLSISEQQ